MIDFNKLYEDANIETIEDLIRFMASFSPRLKTLNFRYFVQCFINTYKASTLFGLECLPYFLFTVQSTMIGSFIVNQPIISDITKTIKGMKNLYQDLPPLDYVIRTSGELRLSNFMMYQASYAEFYFPKVYFPDFGPEEFDKALVEFNKRNRRFGGIKK